MTSNRTFTFSMILKALVLLSLMFCASLQAALQVVEEAHELKTEQILRWPLGAGDSIVVRPCRECGIKTLQVTAETRYSNRFDTSDLSLDELLRQKSLLREGTEHLIVVFYRPDDLTVTRLILQTEF